MYQFFVGPDCIAAETVVITGRDVNHIRNVLRMKPGEEICVSNGTDGKEYRCEIEVLEEDRILCRVRSVKENSAELPARVHLFQGLPKADKMELIIQKAVELGVCEIVPVSAGRCVVKLDDKKAGIKTARWQLIAEAAAKQSRRGIIPQVTGVLSMTEAVKKAASMDVRLIAYELAGNMSLTKEMIGGLKAGQDIAVFIGPEGGFEEAEIQDAVKAGIVPVTLGRRILRTETAGLTVLSWIMYQLEQ